MKRKFTSGLLHNYTRNLLKTFYFIVGLLVCSSCSYLPERVELTYTPIKNPESLISAPYVDVSVHVVDCRRSGKTVGRKKGKYGVEHASIGLSSDLIQEITDAMLTELHRRGFNLAYGGVEVQIEIQKFYNEFKEGFFGGRGISELLLSVNVVNKEGMITFAKTIMGIGENNNVWIHSGNNAKKALDSAMNDAIYKLIRDRAFLQALLR